MSTDKSVSVKEYNKISKYKSDTDLEHLEHSSKDRRGDWSS